LKNKREVRYTWNYNPGYFECINMLATDLVEHKRMEKVWGKNFNTSTAGAVKIETS
jgi:hypothetical protein